MKGQRFVFGGVEQEEKLKFNLPNSSQTATLSSQEEETHTSHFSLKKDEKSFPEDLKTKLSPLENIAVISVLEDTVDKLEILKYLFPGGQIKWFTGYKTLTERFGDRKTDSRKILIFPEEDEKPVLTPTIKMQRDRHFLQHVLKNTLNEMKSNQSYNYLAKSTENIEQRKLEEEELHLQHVANKMMFQNMRMKTSLDKKMQEVQIRLRTRKIASLQNEVHDATVTSQMKLRFVSHWERTREEQNKLRLGKLTDVLKERLQTLEEEQQKEYRVNMAIRRYMDMSQMELLKQVETWMDKYDQDMEIKDHNIFELEFKRLKQQQRYTELRELLEQQRDDMHAWLIYKEEKRSKEEREAMATRIQTWWRDVMVRRGLGRYAKGKSKSKKGKKDKKKGGKKEKAKKKK